MNVGLYSHSVAALAFALLGVLLLISSHDTRIARLLVGASLVSMLWAGLSAVNSLNGQVPGVLLYGVEYLRMLAWFLFLVAVLQQARHDRPDSEQPSPWRSPLVLVAGALALIGLSAPLLLPRLGFEALSVELPVSLWLAGSVLGLILIEQLLRRTERSRRTAIIHLVLGLGGLFVYDFLMYADALLFKRLDSSVWDARGVVNALMVPLIAVSAARNASWEASLHVSREALTYSVTLAASAIYLLVTAAAGLYIQKTGAVWSDVALIGIGTGAIALLAAFLVSTSVRQRVSRALSEHFYSLKYNYRQEWLSLTRTLSESDQSVPERILESLTRLTGSPGATLWMVHRDRSAETAASTSNVALATVSSSDLAALVSHFRSASAPLQLDALRHARDDRADTASLPTPCRWRRHLHRDRHTGSGATAAVEIALSERLLDNPTPWLFLPLRFKESLIGLVLLDRSTLIRRLDWEEADLLVTAGYQCAGALAQSQAADALLEAKQFEAYHKLSTYIVHDLKNILNQQSLIVSNAQRHRDNPEFVDDVFNTIENSVSRMTRMMAQLRAGSRETPAESVDVADLLQETAVENSTRQPHVQHDDLETGLTIEVDRDRLKNVFGHLIQNAQEATPVTGTVRLSCRQTGTHAEITVLDSGHGMSDDFMRHRLFAPFDSTKGLTGMGIGAFESREYVRSLGGDISVASEPGQGAVFTVEVPLARSDAGCPDGDRPDRGYACHG